MSFINKKLFGNYRKSFLFVWSYMGEISMNTWNDLGHFYKNSFFITIKKKFSKK